MSTATTARTRRFSQVEALTLWRRYQATRDPRLRDRLIMTYAPLVKHIVYRKIREVPSHQEADDYISRGLEALITSLDRYDREVAKAARSFRAIHHREPRDEELADALAVSVDELRGHRADVARADVGSLNIAAADTSDDDSGVER